MQLKAHSCKIKQLRVLTERLQHVENKIPKQYIRAIETVYK